jgi:hypothetical protein
LSSLITYHLYKVSPTNAHPPLHLRLTAPHEPGFILRKLRVQSMRDIWSICEVRGLCFFHLLV